MEFSLLEAAGETGISLRGLQHAAASGELPVQHTVGRTQMVDSLMLRAFVRSQGKGRRWSDRSYLAALDLLSTGQTRELGGSELARLRAALRGLDPAGLAHRLGSPAGWYRYRSTKCGLAGVAARVRPTGLSRLQDPRIAERLGLLPTRSGILYGTVRDMFKAVDRCSLVLDSDGDIILKSVYHPPLISNIVIHIYLFGDEYVSDAAAQELLRMTSALQSSHFSTH